LLIFSLTFEPAGRVTPGFGCCEITLPFFTLREKALVTFPTEQCAALMVRLARVSLLPRSFGATHLTTTSKVAVAEWSALIASVHAAVPEQSPDQPANLEPAEGVAVNVTGSAASGAEHVELQSIPAGLDVIVPVPVPALATVRVLPR
jgi:hypothetical protein